MTRTCQRGDMVLIGAIVTLRGDDGLGNAEISADGFEDGLLNVLDRDVSIDGGTLQTRVLVSRWNEDNSNAVSERFLDAQRIALALIEGDDELRAAVLPWLEGGSHGRR